MMTPSLEPSFEIASYPVETFAVPHLRVNAERMARRRRDPFWKLKMLDSMQRWLVRWAHRNGTHPFPNTVKVRLEYEPGRWADHRQFPEFLLLRPRWMQGHEFLRASMRGVRDPDPRDAIPDRLSQDLPVLRVVRRKEVEARWRI